MITVSLCMIVKNEEETLERCLKSVEGVADEIIIADTGSDDATAEIARLFGCRVYSFDWCDDFSAARNFAFSKAEMSHCMWLDADDVLPEQSRSRLISLKASLSDETDVVMLPYQTAFDESGAAVFSYYRERIVRNSPDFRWQGAVHEAITPSGNVVYHDIPIEHRKLHSSDPERNLRIFRRLISSGSKLSPREQFYFGRELYYNREYDEAESVLKNFINSGLGWIENTLDAYRTLALVYQDTSRQKKSLEVLLASLSLGVVRAEILCDIGRLFMEKGDYQAAIFWYESAASLAPDAESGGFIQTDCYGYIPYMQLCVCYDRLGQYAKAELCNEKAGRIKPYSEAYRSNKKYFEQLKNRKD